VGGVGRAGSGGGDEGFETAGFASAERAFFASGYIVTPNDGEERRLDGRKEAGSRDGRAGNGRRKGEGRWTYVWTSGQEPTTSPPTMRRGRV
jgi:hypothetical protein